MHGVWFAVGLIGSIAMFIATAIAVGLNQPFLAAAGGALTVGAVWLTVATGADETRHRSVRP